jgi:hypothetical protein
MLFAKKSVASITARLHDTVQELRAHADHQHDEAIRQEEIAAEARDKSAAHKAERELAKKVADNIATLLA